MTVCKPITNKESFRTFNVYPFNECPKIEERTFLGKH